MSVGVGVVLGDSDGDPLGVVDGLGAQVCVTPAGLVVVVVVVVGDGLGLELDVSIGVGATGGVEAKSAGAVVAPPDVDGVVVVQAVGGTPPGRWPPPFWPAPDGGTT